MATRKLMPRRLSNEELLRLGKALRDLEADPAQDLIVITAIRLIVLSGLLPAQLIHLKWTDVNFRDAVLQLRDRSGEKYHIDASVLSVLQRTAKLSGPRWILSNTEADKPYSIRRINREGQRILEAASLRHVTFADLAATARPDPKAINQGDWRRKIALAMTSRDLSRSRAFYDASGSTLESWIKTAITNEP